MSSRPLSASAVPTTLRDATVVVTGASDGIGKAAVRAFAAQGAQVVMVGRNEAKTAAAARAIMSETGSRTVTWAVADLSRPEAVRELGDRLCAAHPRIRVLANNAGALFMDHALTPDGFERTVALNHLHYVALTMALLPSLVAAAAHGEPARVLNVSSRAHRNARPSLQDLHGARGYSGWRAYANSKLFNLWFTRALSRRVPPALLNVQALHPGVVQTRFATNNGGIGRALRWLMDLNSVTPEDGADTLVWLATCPDALAQPGAYWVRRALTVPSRLARDEALSEQLWAQTDAMLHFDADAVIRTAALRAGAAHAS